MATREDIETYIGRVALGDRAAFAALYSATSAKLFGVTLRVLNNRAEADDALQEVFIKVWRAADRYQTNGLSPMTWLITIARNHAIDRLRARKKGQAGLDEVAELADSAPGPEQQAIASSARAQINDCLDELPKDRAEAVRRVYLDGDTYQDLADAMQVPLNTMRTWLRRSLIKLKDCLSQ
ncbi:MULTISPECIES: sigma-70 family RNA polymerase sigma factor [Rhodobacterales]|uniref:sigma-70 family RNA polymerase sigma factor n=1 Tax=Rhodobacterales TaxID=204455 RepID=UPI0015F06E9C|nr:MULTISPECIES: sigma-70 family RNA polymerase sigma factor [Rhodobacterales]MDO6589074.1 sigma-70 family RNA polymerase sigma factor [Yoonia sp. 1_MG-2023]